MSTPASASTVFRPPLGRRIVGALAGSVILAAIAAAVVPNLLPVTTPRDVRAGLTGVIVVVVVALIWGATLWWGNLRVVVTAEAVEVLRPGMRLHTWPRTTTAFTSHVTERYVNGIRSGTTRALVAHGDGRTDEVPLPLGRDDFGALLALLAPLTEATAPTASTGLPDNAVFTLDASPIRSRALRLAIGAGVALLATGAAFGLLASGILVRADLEAVTIAASVGAVITAVLAVLAATTLGRASGVPATIALAPNVITVDGQSYRLDEVRSVRLSPPAYPVRRLAITDRTGRIRRWLLGEHLHPRGRQLLPEYPALVAAVAAAGAGTDGIVRFDLR